MRGVKWLSLVLSFVVAFSIAGTVYAPVTLPLVYVDPEVSTANPGDTFNVNVNIQDVVDLFSWGIKMEFNPNVLMVTAVTEGSFMQGQPGGTSFVKKIYLTYIDVGCTTLGAYPGVSGDGTLMTVTFAVKDSGKSDLSITKSTLLDSTITLIPNEVADGYFYTIATANLVRRSAWPEHHHFVISKDEDAAQSLFAKVKNLGPTDLYVYVCFDIIRDDTLITTVSSAETVVAPGAIMELSADFTLTSADAGKYYVSASAWYSWSGYYYTQGEKIKTFSFAVVP